MMRRSSFQPRRNARIAPKTPRSARAPFLQAHGMGMVEGPMALAVAGGVLEGGDEVAARALDGGAKLHALRKARSDRRGERTPGAVGMAGLDARAGERVDAVLGRDEIADGLAVDVAAFHHRDLDPEG